MRLTRYIPIALGILTTVACPLRASAQTPPRIFVVVSMYDAGTGNSDADTAISAGFYPVPYLWRFDPTINGIPSPRARRTYLTQQSAASATPRQGWRAFFANQDCARVTGGQPIDANDITATINWFTAQNYPIDYVFADFEGGGGTSADWNNVADLINQLRATTVGAETAVGNFDWFPGNINLGADYPGFADRRLYNSYYLSTAANGMAGLTVAMPVGYLLQAYAIHADDSYSWGPNWWTLSGLPPSDVSYLTYNQQAAIGAAYLSPNERAGMFYGPLEQVSLAKRNLPSGQQLIPWVSAYQEKAGLPALQPAQVPTQTDSEALLEHVRLRGADGFFAFGDDGTAAYTGTYSDGTTFKVASLHAYSADMASTWHSLDWFFALPTQVGTITADRPLNLLTFKNTGGTWNDPQGRNGGIEWSGYQRGNRVLALISNLGNGRQAATGNGTGNQGNWQSVFRALGPDLPATSPVVPPGSHLVVQYLVNPAQATFNGYSVGTVLGAAQGWHTSSANFVVGTANGSGDGGSNVVAIARANSTAWLANSSTANPGGIGATANDAMTYSFRVFTGWSGSGSAAFAPIVGSGSSVPAASQFNGPTLWVFTGGSQNYWAFGSNFVSGGPYHSVNFTPTSNTWYEVQMVVDPSSDTVTVFARNLTTGTGSPTLLKFADTRTQANGLLTTLPANLIGGQESPSLYDGFEISGSAGAQFDDMQAQLYSYPASPQSSYVPVAARR